MKCKDVSALLADYLLNELDDPEQGITEFT